MIQWFPGHMAKALRQIKEKEPLIDLFVVVLDARAPLSTYNKDFDEISPRKPRLFVITKMEYGDEQKLNKIVAQLNSKNNHAILVSLKNASSRGKILKSINTLLKPKVENDLKKGLIKPRLRVIVIGIPNAGKSTLINLMAKSAKTRVANTPGVTRGQQWVNADNIQFLDTPGILLPKMDDELMGIKLAIIGSIKDDVVKKDELFYAAYKLLSTHYPEKLVAIKLEPAHDNIEIYNNLYTLCQHKCFLKANKELDLEKGKTWFINYVRELKGVTYD